MNEIGNKSRLVTVKEAHIKIEKEHKTFPKRYPKIFLSMCLVNIYPPGIEDIITSKFVQWIIYLYSIVPFFLCSGQCLSIYHYLLTAHLPTVIFLVLFRRAAVFTYFFIKYCYAIFGRKRLWEFYNNWNNRSFLIEEISSFEERQEILDKKILYSFKLLFFTMLNLTIIPQAYSVQALMDRYAKGAEYSWYPHDPDSPYHFFLVVLSTIVFFYGFGGAAYDVLCMFILMMLSAQIDYLQETLSKIISLVSVDNGGVLSLDNEVHDEFRRRRIYRLRVIEVQEKFKKWVRVHHLTQKWAKEMEDFFSFFNSVKFIYLGFYATFLVYLIPQFVKKGLYFDIMLALSYSFGLFSMQFFLTRVVDNIAGSSTALFDMAYGAHWFAYPIHLQKTFNIVSSYVKNRPIRFRALYLLYDNTANFLQILNLAYKALSVLLQIEI